MRIFDHRDDQIMRWLDRDLLMVAFGVCCGALLATAICVFAR